MEKLNLRQLKATTVQLLSAVALAIAPFTLSANRANAASDLLPNVLVSEFTDQAVTANGIRMHYVTTGEGEPVVLIPGWPQSWYAWRYVMKELAATGRKVYALDPRGFGDSDKPASGYDLRTAADDIHAFIQAAGISQKGGIDIVSHDVGSWIAYAHADAYPDDVRRLVLSEALIPGSTTPNSIPTDAQNVKSWHFAFNRLNDLPETLVSGHERAYLTWLFDNKSTRSWTIDPAALDEYVRVFSAPGAARAGFEYYRQAFSATGLSQTKARMARKLTMPVLTISGEHSLSTAMLKNMQPLAQNIEGVVLEGCGHYLPEECHAEYSKAISNFWRNNPVR